MREQDFVIIQEQDADGQVTSTPPVRNQQIWERLAEMQESSQSLPRVTGVKEA